MPAWNSIKSTYKELLPDKLIQGYQLDFAIFTTFTLEQSQLHELLYETDAYMLIPKNRVHVFYDSGARSGNDYADSIISEKYLHGIRLMQDEKVYAFHPKVYLLRYEKKEKTDQASYRYINIVMSKNISTADLRDVYALSYGDVSAEDQENGKHISGFIESILDQLEEKRKEEFKTIIEELKKVDFKTENDGNVQSVQFYEAKEVWNTIKQKENMIIISPFLSEDFVKQFDPEKSSLLISTEQGFAKLEESEMKKWIEKSRLYTGGLHAKIYCWPENGQWQYIVGSSNATVNGCNVSEKSGNIEYNLGFAGISGEQLKESLKGELEEFSLERYNVWTKMENEGIPFREYYLNFVNHLCIDVNKEEKYCIKLTYDGNAFTENEYKIQCALTEDYLDGEPDGKCLVWKFESNNPVQAVRVKIVNKNSYIDSEMEEKDRVFYYSIYEKYETSEKEALDALCVQHYKSLLESIQKQIVEGKKRYFSVPKKKLENETETKNKKNNSIDKMYIHEMLMKMRQTVRDEDFNSRLLELKNVAENLWQIDKNNKKQERIVEILDSVMKGESR